MSALAEGAELFGVAADEWREMSRWGAALAEAEINQRVIRAFAAVLSPDDAATLRAEEHATTEPDDFSRALLLLGVSASATRDEVTRRHRELTGEFHPRRASDAVVASAFAERVARLDAALGLIRVRRGWN